MNGFIEETSKQQSVTNVFDHADYKALVVKNILGDSIDFKVWKNFVIFKPTNPETLLYVNLYVKNGANRWINLEFERYTTICSMSSRGQMCLPTECQQVLKDYDITEQGWVCCLVLQQGDTLAFDYKHATVVHQI